MSIPYITNRWQAVYLDFGPGLDTIDAPGLPPVLTVRIVRRVESAEPGEPGDPGVTQSAKPTQSAPLPPPPLVEYLPAWLVSAELLASMCWRMDQANKTAPPGSPDALRRVKRWLALLDALRGIFERLRGKCEDHYNRYELTGGPPPLPTPPTLPVLRLSRGVGIHSPWDVEALGVALEPVLITPVQSVLTQSAAEVNQDGREEEAASPEGDGGNQSGPAEVGRANLRGGASSGIVQIPDSPAVAMVNQHHESPLPRRKSKPKRRPTAEGRLLF